MQKYWQEFVRGYSDYGNYLWYEITHPSFKNYFYLLLIVSLLVWGLELTSPWRKKQRAIRKDFWLDLFYMFFNFFLFSLVAYNAVSYVGVALFQDFMVWVGVPEQILWDLSTWPAWSRFILLFFLADFIQWSVHVALHRFDWLWQFHKLHHSVKEMGFAAHMRYHFMETIFYKTALFLPLTMIGFGLEDLFMYHAFTILIGHLNHANVHITYGPLKYFLNNPVMHLWHHASKLDPKFKHGANYGITLSIWDYIFRTAYVPEDRPDVPLGFPGDKKYPKDLIGQITHPFKRQA